MADTWTDRGGVEYSITDGHVRRFDDDGVVYFDEHEGIEIAGWRKRLREFAERNRLFAGPYGRPAWVIAMLERGEIWSN